MARRRGGPGAPSWGSWRRGQDGFGRLPTEEEEAMFNGRFSIDEDDEGARDNQILTSGIPPNFAAGGRTSGANGSTHEGAIRL